MSIISHSHVNTSESTAPCQ